MAAYSPLTSHPDTGVVPPRRRRAVRCIRGAEGGVADMMDSSTREGGTPASAVVTAQSRLPSMDADHGSPS
jgi:hypothetical protein